MVGCLTRKSIGRSRSWSEPVAVSREQRCSADVVQSGQTRNPSFESDGESAVGRHSIFERLQVTLVSRRRLAPRGNGLEVVVVAMKALSPRHELESTKQEIEAVGAPDLGPDGAREFLLMDAEVRRSGRLSAGGNQRSCLPYCRRTV